MQVDTTGTDLTTAKADATAAIDAMKYLTDEEKADYKQQVADATTADAIDTVVADATAQNLANAKDWATTEIGGLTNLDDAASKLTSINCQVLQRLKQLNKSLKMREMLQVLT